MPVKGTYLAVAGVGAIVLWSGIKGHKWSTVLRDTISGHPVGSTVDQPITTSSAAYGYGTGQIGGPIPNLGVGGSVAKNKAIGAALATVYGWGPGTSNWNSLVKLWDQESGWDNRAQNPSSGAYGIAQALPPTKYPPSGRPPISSASVQIAWGLRYIKQRYGNPDNAWGGYWQRGGWY